jgi:hypothetical protein
MLKLTQGLKSAFRDNESAREAGTVVVPVVEKEMVLIMERIMEMKRSVVCAVLVMAGGSVQAGDILTDFLLPSGGTNFTIKYRNFDMGTLYPDKPKGTIVTTADLLDATAGQVGPKGGVGNEDSWGIALITDIFAADRKVGDPNLPVWTNGQGGLQLTAMFYGERDSYFEQTGTHGQHIEGTGLHLDIWQDGAGNGPNSLFNATLGSGGRTGLDTYTNVTDGTRVLQMVSEAGHLNLPGDFGGPGSEFAEDFNTVAFNGSGSAFLSIVGGNWGGAFNSNTFVPPNAGFNNADNRVSFTTLPNANPVVADWLVQSEDPLVAVLAIPTPTSGLTAMALVGMLGLGRRRRA